MSLSIGIVGLPNVGKSTLFNALTKEQNAEAANYPFCTIEPNKAIVAVPDKRVDKISELTGVQQAIRATIEFVDVAGLVKGASQGEGLGNKFLGNIRDVDAIIHVVRCFDDPNVVHVNEKPDPASDIDVINTELALADYDQLERKIDRLSREVKGNPEAKPVLALAEELKERLARAEPLWMYEGKDSEAFQKLNNEMRFLTAKPIVYIANVGEDNLIDGNQYVEQARAIADSQGAELIQLCAKLEQEMAGLPDEDRDEMLELYGLEESGLEKVIRRGYEMLGLISYFTWNDVEIRVWTIRQGWKAPKAAGVIHGDIERGFIRAEVIPFDAFVEHGSKAAVKAAGGMRVEGSEYEVADGDLIYFRFNV